MLIKVVNGVWLDVIELAPWRFHVKAFNTHLNATRSPVAGSAMMLTQPTMTTSFNIFLSFSSFFLLINSIEAFGNSHVAS